MNLRTDYIQQHVGNPFSSYQQGLEFAQQQADRRRQMQMEEEARQQQQAQALAAAQRSAAVKQAYRNALSQDVSGGMKLNRQTFLSDIMDVDPQLAYEYQQKFEGKDVDDLKTFSDLRSKRVDVAGKIVGAEKGMQEIGLKRTEEQRRYESIAKNQLYAVKTPTEYELWRRAWGDNPHTAELVAQLPEEFGAAQARGLAMQDVGARDQFGAEEAEKRARIMAAAQMDRLQFTEGKKDERKAEASPLSAENLAKTAEVLKNMWGNYMEHHGSKVGGMFAGAGPVSGPAKVLAAKAGLGAPGSAALEGTRTEAAAAITRIITGSTRPAVMLQKRIQDSLPSAGTPKDAAKRMLEYSIRNAFGTAMAGQRRGFSGEDWEGIGADEAKAVFSEGTAVRLDAGEEAKVRALINAIMGPESPYWGQQGGGGAGGALPGAQEDDEAANALRQKWGY